MKLDATLQKAVDNLVAMIDSGDYNQHAVDVFTAIKDCILSSTPIGLDLQDQFVRIIANEQTQDRYGR